MEEKLFIGLKLYREDNPEREYTVSKIGKKYFEVAELSRERFFIETLKKDGGQYSQNSFQLWRDKQTLLDKKETDMLYSKISKHFSPYINKSNTLTQLRDVAKILELE